jgi:hypothetical protein
MLGKVSTFARLSSLQRWQFVQALALLPLMSVALRLFGLRACHSVLSALIPRAPERRDDRAEDLIRATSRMVRLAAARGIGRPSCLPRSMVLWFLLGRRGILAELRVGARKQGAQMQAHAWVEWHGFVLNDRRGVGREYVPFDGFGARIDKMARIRLH